MKKNIVLTVVLVFVLALPCFTQNEVNRIPSKVPNKELPLKRVALFSSGVAYYEHIGKAGNEDAFDFVFSKNQVSDVLKSIAVYDSGAKKIVLKYDSSDTIKKTLQSLSVDLTQGIDITSLFQNQVGSEIIVYAPQEIKGRIICLNSSEGLAETKKYLNLKTSTGLKIINLDDIKEFKFTDPKKNKDLDRALMLLADSDSRNFKKLRLELKGNQKRNIKVAYVMETAVWKPSYRINLGNKEAVFQAWAIVDNSSNFDWKNVDLCLVTGKPISFKQNLFNPYFVKREEVPVSVAGSAEVVLYDDALDAVADCAEEECAVAAEPSMAYKEKKLSRRKTNGMVSPNSAVFSAKNSSMSGERFIFTPAEPVTLERQKSMMIPLKVVTMPIEKFSVFSNIPYRQSVNPKLCIKLKNTSGLKLPAGPITIYDDGYAGDALIEFFPDKAERLIAYGDDMLLAGSNTENSTSSIEKVKIHNGSMEIQYCNIFSKTYNIKNSGDKKRNVIIEHMIRPNSELYKTEKAYEKTDSLYRFKKVIPAYKSVEFEVSEKRINKTIYSIHNFSEGQIIQYTRNSQMPEKAKKLFKELLFEKRNFDKSKEYLNKLQAQKRDLNEKQERTRKNLKAVGDSENANRFMQKLIDIENKLEELNEEIENAEKLYERARSDYHVFIDRLEL